MSDEAGHRAARPCHGAPVLGTRLTAQAVALVLGPTAGRGSVVAADVLG